MAANVEAAVIAHLRGAGIDAYAVPPADRPERFATVEEVGRRSAGSGFLAVRSLALAAWAPTLYGASELMDEVEEAMDAFDADWATDVSEQGRYRFPSEDGDPRYQAVYQITINV